MGRLTRTLLCLWVAAVAGAIANMALMVPAVLAHSMGWLTTKSAALPVVVVTMTLCVVGASRSRCWRTVGCGGGLPLATLGMLKACNELKERIA